MTDLEAILRNPDQAKWKFPVAYDPDGAQLLTLSDVLHQKPRIKLPHELSEPQWRRLVSAGMRQRPGYWYVSPLGSIKSPLEAVRAIEGRTALGDDVLTTQQEFLSRLLAEIYGWPVPESPRQDCDPILTTGDSRMHPSVVIFLVGLLALTAVAALVAGIALIEAALRR